MKKLITGLCLTVLLGILCFTIYAQQKATMQLSVQVNHDVILTWTASQSSGVTGYNVYRGPGSSGPWARIITTSTTTYQDTTTAPGQSYAYYVTALNPNESAPSNIATCTIPNP